MISRIKAAFYELRASTNLSFHYTVSDIKSRPRNFCIGILSIFLIVFFTALVLTAISKTTYVILRFSELQTGEIDAVFTAYEQKGFINYSQYGPIIDDSGPVYGTSPRWVAKSVIKSLDAIDGKYAKHYIEKNVSTNLLIIDSVREKKVNIGRDWPYRSIGFSELQIYDTLLEYLNVKSNNGERVLLNIDMKKLLNQQGFKLNEIDRQEPNPITNISNSPNIIIGDIVIPSSVALMILSFLRVKKSSNSNETMSLLDALNQTFTASLNVSSIIPENISFTVADGIQDSSGKFPTLLGNVAIFDYKPFLEMLYEQNGFKQVNKLKPNITYTGNENGNVFTPPDFNFYKTPTILPKINLSDYALMIVSTLKDRFKIYYSEKKERDALFIKATNEIFNNLGYDFEVNVQYPLPRAMYSLYFFQLFLSSIFTTVVIIIVVLGGLLVYMLLDTNSEERQFEIAIIRAQGMKRLHLLHLLLSQMFVFVVPGIIIGIVVMILVNIVIEKCLSLYTAAPPSYSRIPLYAILIALFLGVFMPLLSSIGPFRAVFKVSLRDALNVYRQQANEVTVTIRKLSELGLEVWQTLLGWFLTISGFIVYYLVPFSFINYNLFLFFLIMDFILLTMVFGLCLLSYSLQGVIQKGILWLSLWGKERRLWTLIKKNMLSHKSRNSLAYLMFTISVACIIFGGVLFTLLSNSFSNTIRIVYGSDIVLISQNPKVPLDKEKMIKLLKYQSDIVDTWAFSTFELYQHQQFLSLSKVSSADISTYANIPVVGVDKTFQDAIFPEFFMVYKSSKIFKYSTTQGKPNIIKSIYESHYNNNYVNKIAIYTGMPEQIKAPDISRKSNITISCILASGTENMIGVVAGKLNFLHIKYRTVTQDVDSIFFLEPRALMNKVSGFPGISSDKFGLSAGKVITSIPMFRSLLIANSTDFPNGTMPLEKDADIVERYQRLFIKLRPGISGKKRNQLVNFIQSMADPYSHYILDTEQTTESVKSIANLIIYFFYFVSFICFILDTFMLWLAFISNVRSQAWSFGVLRSLGFNVGHLMRSYIYEAFCIVISGFIVGTIIGILVAITLIMQINVFLKLPFEFGFPYGLFFFLLGFSLVSSVAGSYFPTKRIAKISISLLIKKAD